MLNPPEQFWFTHIEQATSPSMDLEISCRFCNRHRSFYGFIDGWCLVCRCSWRWSGTDYRLRAVASSASSRVNNALSKRVLLQGVTKDIVQQHLDGCWRAIRKDARRSMWKRILLGHFCTQAPPDEDSDSSRAYSDPEDEVEAFMRRASRPTPNPFWKIMTVWRRRRRLGRYDNVIYLVIDFLGLGVLPHHALRPPKREQGRLLTPSRMQAKP